MLSREQPEPRERIAEWSRVMEMFAQLLDAVRVNTAATIAVAGGKPGPVRPVPRPVTAIDRVKRERRIAEHRQLVAQVRGRSE